MGRSLLERRTVQILDTLGDPEYELTDIQRAGGDAEVRLAETFADYVVIAIENVRLFQTVERQGSELARFPPSATSSSLLGGSATSPRPERS